MSDQLIPVTVLTGYLGAGKTLEMVHTPTQSAGIG